MPAVPQTTSRRGLIVGLALFGSVTLMPVYLQIVRGASPQMAGLQLTPMMGGVLITSISSGQAISRLGRYKPFPIVGTAIVVIAMQRLSTLGVDSSSARSAGPLAWRCSEACSLMVSAATSRLLPPGIKVPPVTAPAALAAAPASVRFAYRSAVALALHPVFQIATGLAVLAFLLTFTLKEIRLRNSVEDVPAEGG